MKLILCADDFAQTAAIDQAIILLIKQKRLSAASCMTLSPRWQQAAKLITPSMRKQAAIGLHLDFTHFGNAYSHPKLILLSSLRLLPKKEIEASITLQLDLFEAELGTKPDYVDGHQHVHQLPQIRDALIRIMQQRYGKNMPWLRVAKPPLSEGIKGLIIRLLGASALRRKALTANISCTEDLLGVYAFDGDEAAYKARFVQWLKEGQALKTKTVPLLMCHPSLGQDCLEPNGIDLDNLKLKEDAIYPARVNEFKVFNSDFMRQTLNDFEVELVKTPTTT
jgi:predicted glycoside hydrolase/deacetylase ChbG (UPF0249 family)